MKKLLLALTLCVLPLSAEAGNPACGQPLSGTWTLVSDLDCSIWLTHGLDLQSFASLNCNGFKIIGPDLLQPNGTTTGRYGLRIDEKQDVTVTNCHIKGYERGVNISESTNVSITGGSSKKNTKYGYNIGVNSGGVTLDGVQAINNGDEGIHMGGPFVSQNTVKNSLAYLNWQEGVYLHKANGVLLMDTQISDNSQDPNASHPDLNVDESTDLTVSNISVSSQIRVIASPQASASFCLSSVAGGC